MSDDAVKALADELRAAGYVVFKATPCTRQGGHGKHSLRTKTICCEGVEPIPHGLHSVQHGTFGWWVLCQCGHDFASYGDAPTAWERHVEQFDIPVAAAGGRTA